MLSAMIEDRQIEKSREDAVANVDRSLAVFHELIIRATRHWRITPRDAQVLRFLSGSTPVGPRPLLSDLRARREASYLLIELLSCHWSLNRFQPGQTYLFLTFIDDMGNTSDRRPEVNLGALKGKIDKATRRMGLNGIAMIENQAITNYPRKGGGRTLMFHAHAVAWTTDPALAHRTAMEINRSTSWNNSFGAVPLKIKEMTAQRGEIDHLAYYISKLPYDAKNRMPHKERPGRHILMQTIAGYPPELALRIFEGLSQIELPDVVFGVGEGTALRADWLRGLMAWHRERLAGIEGPPQGLEVAEFWRELRTRRGSKLFEPYRWLTGDERPKSVHLAV